MKFKMSFGAFKIAVVTLVILGALALIALDICLLVGVGALHPASPLTAGVSMTAAAIIIAIALLLLLNCYYKFKDGYLKVVVGFFADKIYYADILALRNYANGSVYLIVKDLPRKKKVQGDKQSSSSEESISKASDDNILCTGVPINVSAHALESFVNALKENVQDIKIENC